MPFKQAVRYVKRGIRNVGRMARKRYIGKGGRVKISQVVRDVKYLKDTINSEKKRIVVSVTDSVVGQCNINNSGLYSADLTPVPAQGVAFNQRTGSSIKLHSTNFNFQFQQNANQSNTVRGKIVILQQLGAPVANPGVNSGVIWDDNPFVGGGNIVDYNSNLDPDAFGQYRILRVKKFVVRNDELSSATSITTFRMGMKYNRGKGHHIRFSQNSTTVLDGQLLMYVLLDNGNASSVTPSTLTGTVDTAINTGLLMQYNYIHYYYDN